LLLGAIMSARWRGRSARVSDRELDRRLQDAVVALEADEVPTLAASVRTAIHRLFPLHCAGCEEIPHPGKRCRGGK
jgi:hypothetical protein